MFRRTLVAFAAAAASRAAARPSRAAKDAAKAAAAAPPPAPVVDLSLSQIPWSPAHESVLRLRAADAPSVLVTGVAGCGKTELLVRTALAHFLAGRRVLVVTLVGAVRDELAARVNALLPRPLRLVGATHKLRRGATREKIAAAARGKSAAKEVARLAELGIADLKAQPPPPPAAAALPLLVDAADGEGGGGAAAGDAPGAAPGSAGGALQVSTIDGAIHQMLARADAQWLRENGDRHALKVRRLLALLDGAAQPLRRPPPPPTTTPTRLLQPQSEAPPAAPLPPAALLLGATMNDGATADVLLIDEFQDVDSERARLLARLAAAGFRRAPAAGSATGGATGGVDGVVVGGGFSALAVGDLLQTVFDHAIEAPGSHPFSSWAAAAPTRVVELSTCFRCPAAHVALANALLAGAQRARRLQPILAARGAAPGSRPLLFAHEPTARNAGAADAAARVAALVASYFDADPTLRPADVAVVMAKVNNSAVMGQLEGLLEKEFERRFGGAAAEGAAASGGAEGAAAASSLAPLASLAPARRKGARKWVHLFATEADAARISVKWSRARGKASLSSVHAIKGRSARLVVFLGVTEGAVPREFRVHRHVELVDHSVLNVGLTRSTQYLALGFAARRPSRYLYAARAELRSLALATWPAADDDLVGSEAGEADEAGEAGEAASSLLEADDEALARAPAAPAAPPAAAAEPDAVERAVLLGYARRLSALQLEGFSRPDWRFARDTYLRTASGRPEHLLFPVRLLADRNQALVDGDAAFDPASFARRALPGARPAAFPPAVDADDDLVACTMGALGELALQVAMRAPNIAQLAAVLRALQGGAEEAAAEEASGGARRRRASTLFRGPRFDVIYSDDEKALAQWWDLGVNERLVGGAMDARAWRGCLEQLEERDAAGDLVYARAHRAVAAAYGEGGGEYEGEGEDEGEAEGDGEGEEEGEADDNGDGGADGGENAAAPPPSSGAFSRPVLLVDASLRGAPAALLAGVGEALAGAAGGGASALAGGLADETPGALWGAAVVSSLLTQRVRRARLAELLDACPSGAGGWWPRLRGNVLALAEELALPSPSGPPQWRFGVPLELSAREADRGVLDAMTVDAARESVKVGVRGFADGYDAATRTLLEVKVGLGDAQRNPAPLWTAQSAFYCALAAEPGAAAFAPTRMLVADLGNGTVWAHGGRVSLEGAAGERAAAAAAAAWPAATRLQASARAFLGRAMTRELFRPEHVDRVLRKSGAGAGANGNAGKPASL